MRSLMFKSPPSTAKYDTTSLNEIEMTSTAMPRPKKNSFVKYKFETKFNTQKLLPTVFGSSSLTWISVPMRPNSIGWKMTQKSARVFVTVFSSDQPSLRLKTKIIYNRVFEDNR